MEIRLGWDWIYYTVSFGRKGSEVRLIAAFINTFIIVKTFLLRYALCL